MKSLQLEEFGHAFGSSPKDPLKISHEAGRTEGYDAGYSSGWEDAMRAQEDKRLLISAELERSIDAANLSTTDALEMARLEAQGLVFALLEKLFEPILPEATCLNIRQALQAVIDNGLTGRACVSAHPRTLEGLRRKHLLPDVDLDLREEETLAEDQVVIQMSGQEQMIDLRPVVAQARGALEAELNKQSLTEAGNE